MNSPIPIGLGAGLVSAVLFASSATGSILALVLFYLAPLPLYLAGLGWGVGSGIVAGVAGTGVAAAALGPLAGGVYFITLGLPAALLCYLALLSRPVPQAAEGAAAAQQEWYPMGRVVAWATLAAGSLAALSVPLLGTDLATYKETVEHILDNTLFKQLSNVGGQPVDKERLGPLIDLLVRALPAASAMVWLGIMLLNMWTGGRIVHASGRSIRPWPDLSELEYPRPFPLFFIGAMLLTFAPDILGIIATGFAGAFLLAYVLFGLVVLHVVAARSPYRIVMLAVLYLLLFMVGWVALVVALIGVGEPVLRLRERASNVSGPGSGGGGSNT